MILRSNLNASTTDSDSAYLVCCTHPNYLLCRLFSIVSSVSADNKGRSGQLVADSRQSTLNEVFRIMLTHEDFSWLAQATCTGLLAIKWLCWNFDALQRHLRRYAGLRGMNHGFNHQLTTITPLHPYAPFSVQIVTFNDVT